MSASKHLTEPERRAREAEKRKVQRRKHKARALGLSTVPAQLWFGHPWGCPCYDCLYGETPWRTKAREEA